MDTLHTLMHEDPDPKAINEFLGPMLHHTKPEKIGFALVVFDEGTRVGKTRVAYSSSGNRFEVAKVLRDMVARLEAS